MSGINRTKVALDALGCKLNQAETELFAQQFAEAGYRLVSSVGEADIYVLNTCTVTHIADRKSRHLLRMAHRCNPKALVVATGCYAQRAPNELAQLEGVDLVLNNEQKSQLRQVLEESGRLNGSGNGVSDCFPAFRTRAFIKMQDGCTNFCAYCIVPLVRGGEKSLPAEDVLAEVKHRVAQGCQEVVLTGVRVGAYHDNGANLKGLLERILNEAGITRVRLSSLQPQEISRELIGLWQDERLCPHFHLSLQSGSESVLRRMKRRYSLDEYQQAVSLIRSIVPEAAITTDVIAGFPGETDKEFAESYDFCRQMGFARIHVFPYSSREGTEAARLPQRVEDKVKRQRCQKMLALAEESARNFRRQFQGRMMMVLWEKQSEEGLWSGLTGNYLKVYARSRNDLTNKLLPVELA